MFYSIERETSFIDYSSIPHLDGTAFNVAQQIELLFKHRDINRWLTQTETDLEYLYREFMAQFKAIPFSLYVVETESGKKLYCPNYGQFFLNSDEATVSWKERDGGPRASLGRIEEFLLNTDTGAMAAFVSPPGWSGLKDEQGQELFYPDTQIYLYKKIDENSVEALTLVVDKKQMALDQTERYLGYWNQNIYPTPKRDRERIKDVVLAPLFFQANENRDFIDFAYAISEACGGSVDELLNHINSRDRLNLTGEEIKDVIQHFSEEVQTKNINLANNVDVNWLENLLRRTVLDMSAASRGISLDEPRQAGFYDEELARLQQASQQGPCPVTPGPTRTVLAAGGLRIVKNGKEVEILKCVNCPSCNKTVDAEIYDGEIHCPKCGAKVPYKQALPVVA